MRKYLDLLDHVLKTGVKREDRTGTGTIGIFGYQMRFDLAEGFPLLTTKKVHTKSILHELLWFIKGDTNIKYLKDNGVTIWDAWADKDGDLGPVYGKQWRNWEGLNRLSVLSLGPENPKFPGDFYRKKSIDQLADVIQQIKTNPNSRRLVVSAWNPVDVPEMALPPCHCLFQFFIANGKLSCQLYQRSADIFLGVPFNIASYAMLTHMVAQVCGLQVGEFIHTLGDAHIYLNHLDQVKEQLSREPYDLPELWVNPEVKDINDFKFEDIKVEWYVSHDAIKAPIAV